MLTMPTKDPAEVLDYYIDWSSVIATDETIVSSVWTTTAGGLLVGSSYISTNKTIVWLSGGLIKTSNTVKNVITTSAGRTFVQSLDVPVAYL